MKVSKKAPKKVSPFANPGIILIAGLVILALFFLFYGKDTPKNQIVPEVPQKVIDQPTETKKREIESVESVPADAPTVDSGIENLEQVPKYEGDREEVAPSISEDASVSTGSVVIWSGQSQSGQVLPTYINSTYHYGFSMPKNSYYAAFGAQEGASHSVGVSTTGSGTEALATSDVRVYFYANKVLDELKGAENGFARNSTTGTIYILLGEMNSVRIESEAPDSELVKTIVRTMYME